MHQSNRLSELIAKVRDHRMSAGEKRAQRVSMVMGLRGHSSTLTRERVETLLDEVEGASS